MWQIDFDFASVSGKKLRHLNFTEFADDADLMRAALSIPHGGASVPVPKDPNFAPVVTRFVDSLHDQALYAGMRRMDQMVHYKDMTDTVKAIRKLSKRPED